MILAGIPQGEWSTLSRELVDSRLFFSVQFYRKGGYLSEGEQGRMRTYAIFGNGVWLLIAFIWTTEKESGQFLAES